MLGANASLSAARARVDGGRLDLQGGVLTTMDSDALTLNDGKLTGTGWIESLAAGGGAVVNNGQLAPGLHGTLRFAGFSTVSNTPAGEMAFIIQTSVAGATNNLIERFDDVSERAFPVRMCRPPSDMIDDIEVWVSFLDELGHLLGGGLPPVGNNTRIVHHLSDNNIRVVVSGDEQDRQVRVVGDPLDHNSCFR